MRPAYYDKDVAERIRKAREDKGMSRPSLSSALEELTWNDPRFSFIAYSEQSLKKFEGIGKYRCSPNIPTLMAIGEVLDISYLYLLTGKAYKEDDDMIENSAKNEEIGARLKEVIKERGLTYEHLAEKTKMSKGLIGNYCRGDVAVSAPKLAKLCKVLDISADYILFGNIEDSQNRCVCCGEIIPEGRMICWGCEKNIGENIKSLRKRGK